MCQGDDYACLKAYRNNPLVRANLSEMDQRDFAHEFLRYEGDANNFALYLWGYVDIMLDYYKNRNPSIISSQSIRENGKYDRKNGILIVYGEPGVYP